MNGFRMLLMILSCLLVFVGPFFFDPKNSPATSPEKADGQKAAEEKAEVPHPSEGGAVQKDLRASQKLPVYKPPLRGSPEGRVGGGTRALPIKREVSLQALAPDHVGLTVHEQPNLYWFISALPASQIEFTMIEAHSTVALIEERLKSPKQPGIQCIRLSDHSIRLWENKRYKWFITLVADPDHRYRNVFAGGFIERIPVPGDLAGMLQKAGKRGAHYVYGEQGIWYDALSAISEFIAGSPGDGTLRRERASLLQQVGLEEVAAYDVK
jgi:hypothetical protein